MPCRTCRFFCVAQSADTFWIVATLFIQLSHEYARGDNAKRLLMGFLLQRAAGPWFKVLQGNLSKSGQLNPEQSWRETLVTCSVTLQRPVSFRTICPTSEGSLNREGRQAHWDDGRRARVLWSSVFQDESSAAEQESVWSFRKWGRREKERMTGALVLGDMQARLCKTTGKEMV